MRDHFDDMPIACALTTAELRYREATLLVRFRSAATEELQEGYAFRVAGDSDSIRLIAELMVAERQCCPFLTFGVSALPNLGPLTVRMIGPAGTKQFLIAVFCGSLLNSILDELYAERSNATKEA
jgi:hypothetical protein